MCFGGSMPKQELPEPPPPRPPAPQPLAQQMSNPLAIGYAGNRERRRGKAALTQTRNPTLSNMGLGIAT